MTIRQVKKDILAVGAIDWDRRLFDSLIPLPHGTSYNSFLIQGSEKTALIDAVYPPKRDELFNSLKDLNIKKLDYIIANHGEQDHTGSIPILLEKYPEAMVVTNSKCKNILIDLHHIAEDKFIEVNNTTTISLGNKTLSFIMAPWVHWPDTMFTYLQEDKILFTCDFLGSHLATSDLFVKEEGLVYESAKRYYAEIMMPFKTSITKYLDIINSMDVEIIAPSHGPLYDKPEFILNAYKDWTSGKFKNEVVIPYVSMYESTEKMVDYLTNALIAKGIKVTPFNLTKTDLGEIAIALVDASTLVFGTSMVLMAPHPQAVYSAVITNALKPNLKFVSGIGSYGWATVVGEKMADNLKALMPCIKAEMLQPVFVKGKPKAEDYKRLDALAEEIHAKHLASMN